MPNSGLPGNRLPSAEAAERLKDPQYQNPLAAIASGSCPHRLGVYSFWVLAKPDAVVQLHGDSCGSPEFPVPGVGDHSRAAAAPEWNAESPFAVPAYDFGGKYHRFGGYSGYTSHHLPVNRCRPPEFRNRDAAPAIRAAFMARSSLPTRSRLR